MLLGGHGRPTARAQHSTAARTRLLLMMQQMLQLLQGAEEEEAEGDRVRLPQTRTSEGMRLRV